jgi:hypothetical protein
VILKLCGEATRSVIRQIQQIKIWYSFIVLDCRPGTSRQEQSSVIVGFPTFISRSRDEKCSAVYFLDSTAGVVLSERCCFSYKIMTYFFENYKKGGRRRTDNGCFVYLMWSWALKYVIAGGLEISLK